MHNLKELKQVLAYNPKTGAFIWRANQKDGQIRAGSEAGTISKIGYRYIGYKSHRYLAHRLAWLFVHGDWPSGHLDHANKNPLDNRIVNLRECSRSQNQFNRGKQANNKSGLKGVSYVTPARGKPKWRATIGYQGKQVWIGHFDTKEEAHKAYCAKAAELHKEFARAK